MALHLASLAKVDWIFIITFFGKSLQAKAVNNIVIKFKFLNQNELKIFDACFHCMELSFFYMGSHKPAMQIQVLTINVFSQLKDFGFGGHSLCTKYKKSQSSKSKHIV